MTWKRFPLHMPFDGFSPITEGVSSKRANNKSLMFSLMQTRISCWTNIPSACDLRRHRAHWCDKLGLSVPGRHQTKRWRFTRLISSSKGSALTVWYKTKVGSHNFGYQLWFCIRLVTVDWGSAVTMTLCSSWCHWYILSKDMSINSKYQEANIIVQNALPTTNRYGQYLYKQDDLYILRQPA